MKKFLRLSRKLKSGRSTIDFKRKGNEKQYSFNEGVYEMIEVAESKLSKPLLEVLLNGARSSIKHALTEGKEAPCRQAEAHSAGRLLQPQLGGGQKL